MSKTFFYLRVSRKGQNLQLQIDAMNKFIEENHVEDPKIYQEKQSGTNTNRSELQACLKAMGKGDLLVIWSLDRISRNYNECKQLWADITGRGIDIHVITMPMLDTRNFKGPMESFINDLIISILSYVGQQETELRRERARAGVKAMAESNEMTQPYRRGNKLIESHPKKISAKTNKVVGRPSMTYPKNFASIVQQQKEKKISLKQALAALDMPKSSYYKLVKQYENEHGPITTKSNTSVIQKGDNK